MQPHQKIEHSLREHLNNFSTIEPLKLYFVGDLPANKVLNVPRHSRQSKIFDQFAHREMVRKMRSRNHRNFKLLDTVDSSRLGGSVPRPSILRSTEFNLDQTNSQTPYNSYLLKERLSQVRARLPSILCNYSAADVLELVGNSARPMMSTPDMAEYEQIQRKYSQQKKSQEGVLRLSQLVLPQISTKRTENDQVKDQEKNAETISTECQSPEKPRNPGESREAAASESNDPDTTKRIKQIVEDIVTKTKNQHNFAHTHRKSFVKGGCVALPIVELRTPVAETERPLTSRPVKKGYLVHDEAVEAYWNSWKSQVHERAAPPTHKTKLPNNISADQYCILNLNTMQFVVSETADSQIEIASLSKVVTALLTILVCRKYEVDMKVYRCRVSDEAAEMPGTTAELEVGDMLTIEDLLYGLMLPSGNDAATVLAECIGKIIQKHKKKPSVLPPARTFVRHMNILYKELLSSSEEQQHIFQNPSGLSCNPNKTSAEQITLISAVAIKNELFRKIVSTKDYETAFKNERYGLNRRLSWKNTNKLLWKQWQGVKTGTTETAGHCFIGQHRDYLISVFDCATMNKRFSDAQKLAEWLAGEQSS